MAKLTIPEYGKRLRMLRKEINKTTLPPIRKALARARKGAKDEYKRTTLGAALWGRRRKSRSQFTKPALSVKTPRKLAARLSASERAFIGGVEVKGIAALMETGGRIAPHRIRPRKGSFLYFTVPGTGLVRARTVNHPGMTVPRRPVIEKQLGKQLPKLMADVKDTLVATYSRLVI